jgi:NDP-sugar pyrophosphorylase family protein
VSADPVVSRSDCLAALDILVLAGGLGTRIRPVLGDIPKLLAIIGGRPYLDRLLDWLGGFGARRMVLGLGHLSGAVTEYLQAHPRSDLEISYVVEPRPLGTAGAIRFARRALHSDPVLVINGDSIADVDFCGMVASHQGRRPSGTLLCAEVEDAGRYGCVVIDGTGSIEGFVEKDPAFEGAALVNAGIYLLSATLLDQIEAGQAVSLERDVFERLPPRSLSAFTDCFDFIDIGTPESLVRAGAMFAAGGRSKRQQAGRAP